MAAKNKVTLSSRPTGPRLSSAERRAAQIAMLSTKQAELKQEAAERRIKRGADQDASPASPPRNKPARRSTAR